MWDTAGIDTILIGFDNMFTDIEPLVSSGFFEASKVFFIGAYFKPLDCFDTKVFIRVFVLTGVEANWQVCFAGKGTDKCR